MKRNWSRASAEKCCICVRCSEAMAIPNLAKNLERIGQAVVRPVITWDKVRSRASFRLCIKNLKTREQLSFEPRVKGSPSIILKFCWVRKTKRIPLSFMRLVFWLHSRAINGAVWDRYSWFRGIEKKWPGLHMGYWTIKTQIFNFILAVFFIFQVVALKHPLIVSTKVQTLSTNNKWRKGWHLLAFWQYISLSHSPSSTLKDTLTMIHRLGMVSFSSQWGASSAMRAKTRLSGNELFKIWKFFVPCAWEIRKMGSFSSLPSCFCSFLLFQTTPREEQSFFLNSLVLQVIFVDLSTCKSARKIVFEVWGVQAARIRRNEEIWKKPDSIVHRLPEHYKKRYWGNLLRNAHPVHYRLGNSKFEPMIKSGK